MLLAGAVASDLGPVCGEACAMVVLLRDAADRIVMVPSSDEIAGPAAALQRRRIRLRRVRRKLQETGANAPMYRLGSGPGCCDIAIGDRRVAGSARTSGALPFATRPGRSIHRKAHQPWRFSPRRLRLRIAHVDRNHEPENADADPRSLKFEPVALSALVQYRARILAKKLRPGSGKPSTSTYV